jgi:small redox-active disulfide protein 2
MDTEASMEIKILGTGCPKCKELERRTRSVLVELDAAADVEKVTDIRKIMEYGILSTPGLVIDGKVKSSGRLPRADEIKAWIQEVI